MRVSQRQRNWFVSVVIVALFATVFWLTGRPRKSADFGAYSFQYLERWPAAKIYDFHKKKVDASPKDFLEINELANVCLQIFKDTGDLAKLDEAQALADRSLQLLPMPNPGANCAHTKIMEMKHEFESAIQASLAALDNDPHDSCALNVLIMSQIATGDLTEAAKYADLLLLKKPLAENHITRALVLESQGRFDEALFDYTRFFQKEEIGDADFSANARYYLARLYLRRGNFSDAQRLAELAISIAKHNPKKEFYNLLGDIHYEQNNFADAEKVYLQSLGVRPSVETLRRLAEVKFALHEPKPAVQYLAESEKIARSEINGAYGHTLDLVRILLLKKTKADVDEAVGLAVQEVKRRPSAEAYLVLSQALTAAGARAESFEAIQTALRKGFASSEYLFQSALVEWSLDNPSRAKFYLAKAQDLSPRLRALVDPATLTKDNFKTIALTR